MNPMFTANGPMDEPVFSEPWQAQAFAMVLSLHQRGLFSWTQWAATLTRHIEAAQTAGDADLGDTYYDHWLSALEELVITERVALPDELPALQRAWAHAAQRTPHGQAIELQAQDHLTAAPR